MLDLSKANAPESVNVNGAFYAVHTDFRYWIIFSRMLLEEHTYLDYDLFYINEKPADRKAGFDSLLEFFVNKKELPRVFDSDSDVNVLDYDLDSELIFSAFMELYGIDLISEKTHLHWWKFKALLAGLHGTKLNEVMGYRCYVEGQKTDWKQTARENKRRWELPQKLTGEEKEASEEFDRLLNA